MGDTGPDKFVRRNSTLEAIESLGASDLVKVKEHVDDDLLSCFLWAAGENAMNQSGWESPKGNALGPEIESREILLGSLPDASLSASATTKVGATTRSNCAAPTASAVAGANGAGAAAAAGRAAAAGSVAAEKVAPSAVTAPSATPTGPTTAGAASAKQRKPGESDDSGSDSDDDDPNAVGPSGTPLTKESKLLQRMQRKAESARIARLRKKDYVSGLEEQVKELQAELKAIEDQLAATPAAPSVPTVAVAAPRAAAGGTPLAAASGSGLKPPPASKEELTAMDALLRRPSVERLTPEIQNTIEKYVKSKRQRFDQISVYLDGIEEILQPGTAVQVAFGQSASLAAANSMPSDGGPLTKRHRRDSSAGSHLLEVLSAELGITATQAEQLAQFRDAIRKDREILVESEAIIKELRARVSEHIQSSQGITDGLRKILTPQQIAKFLTWVEKNHKSMDMLNSFDWEMHA